MKVNYKCKENDVELRFICEDGIIDEIWIKDDHSWTVIGHKDLLAGIKKAERKCRLKDSSDFGGGYIGEALFNLD